MRSTAPIAVPPREETRRGRPAIAFDLPLDMLVRLDEARGGLSRSDAVAAIVTALLGGSAKLVQVSGRKGGAPDIGRSARKEAAARAAPDRLSPDERRQIRKPPAKPGGRGAVWIVILLTIFLGGSIAFNIRLAQDVERKDLAIRHMTRAAERTQAANDTLSLQVASLERDLAVAMDDDDRRRLAADRARRYALPPSATPLPAPPAPPRP